jgi:putative membrane protein
LNPAGTPEPDPDPAPRRLHPVTLVQQLILSLPGFLALMYATYRTPDSTNWISLVIAVLYALVTLPLIYLRYERFRYWITPNELVIRSGVLTKKHRNIPLEKIQNVEIVQRLIPRLTSTARVQVETAGSASAEGVLEFVSIREAERIRQVVRDFNRSAVARSDSRRPKPLPESVHEAGSPHRGHDATESSLQPDPGKQLLFKMEFNRVLLSGAFRFSLLYIAIIFSLIQFFQPDPEALAEWVLRERYDQFIQAARGAPFIAVVVAIISAALLSWISGIVVNVNKYFGFKLWSEAGKVSKRSGLLTISEGSIPKRKIQALIISTNPLMKALDWWSASVQTMGISPGDQGRPVVAPFVRWEELKAIRPHLVSADLPISFEQVSTRRVVRLSIRYLFLLAATAAALYFVWSSWWVAFAFAPVVVVIAWMQWRAHGYAVGDEAFVVRRGVLRKRIWVLPYNKMQVFYSTQSLFQRRRDLRSIYVDTAGASSFATPAVYDVRTDDAARLVNSIYARFIDQTS